MIGRPSNVKVFYNNKYILQIDTLTNGRMKWVRVTIACSMYVLVWMLVALHWQHTIFVYIPIRTLPHLTTFAL